MDATSMFLCRLIQAITRKQDLNTRGQMCEALEAYAGWLNDNVNVSDGAIFLVGLAGALSGRTDIEGPRHALDVIKNLERLPSDMQDDGTMTHWGCNRQISDSQNGIDFSNSPGLDTDNIFHDGFDSKYSELGIYLLFQTGAALIIAGRISRTPEHDRHRRNGSYQYASQHHVLPRTTSSSNVEQELY